ncbi:MAG: hypothetical protein HC934_06350 [Acaryochloridaceae cyanobacterium SU_2_1]|nr:hypothetical protein [Acaryochloridaceae cyanobacterium SU_2_1]
MKNILTSAGLTVLATGILSFGSANIGHAQTAAIEPLSSNANYGLVSSFDGQNLVVRTLDGASKTYSVPPGAGSSLTPGELVGFDVDKSDQITRVQPPAVSEVLRGTITDIDPATQTVTILPTGGTPVDTRISQGTISRLGLEPGRDVIVTRYANTWAEKVCLGKAAAPPFAAPPVPEPIPTGGFEPPPTPTPAPPIEALW